MAKGEYKDILFKIYDVLGFSEEEKQRSLASFKNKFALDLMMALEGKLSKEQQDWLAANLKNKDADPEQAEILHDLIKELYSNEELDQVSHNVFKKILKSYVDYMSPKVGSEKVSKLAEIAGSV